MPRPAAPSKPNPRPPRPAPPAKPNPRTPQPAPPAKLSRPAAKPAGEPSPVARSSRRASATIPTDTALTVRELNRAFLARQLLLERAHITPKAAIEQLVALQSQVARPPFIGLWTRLHAFTRAQLHQLLHDRHVVRATFLRVTLHLVTAADYLALRPALQPMLTASFRTLLKGRADNLDLAKLTAYAHTKLPATFEQLRPQLAQQFRTHDERALGYAVRTHLPLVQVPTDDPWAFPSSAAFASAESWLAQKPGAASAESRLAQEPVARGGERSGRGAASAESWLAQEPGSDPSLLVLVRRYLAAFGPATIRDAQRWSGIADLAPAFEALRPDLVTFRDDKRRELFDLPGAPRPPADTAAPVRFLPDFDNLILGHDDRRRIVADEHRPTLTTKNLQVKATFLVDGFVAGTWTIERAKHTATLALTPFVALSKPTRTALEAEGDLLLAFVEPDATTRVVRIPR